jgi:hypothetical protein
VKKRQDWPFELSMTTSNNDVEAFFKDLEEEFRLAKDLLTLLKMKEVRDDIRSLDHLQH